MAADFSLSSSIEVSCRQKARLPLPSFSFPMPTSSSSSNGSSSSLALPSSSLVESRSPVLGRVTAAPPMLRPSLLCALETPSTQFARLSFANNSTNNRMLASSSSVMASPTGKQQQHQSLLMREEFHIFHDLDEIGCSLAEILSQGEDDDEEEDDGEGELMMGEESQSTIGRSVGRLFRLETIIEEVLESSIPPSPSKQLFTPQQRHALTDISNNTNNSNSNAKRAKPVHWSRHSQAMGEEEEDEEMIPIRKARRTFSESCIPPTPVSMLASPTGKTIIVDPSSTDMMTCTIPSHVSPKDAIRRITPSTLVDLLDGKYQDAYDRLIIVDSRYPYEYLGGHIPSAINICGLEAAERHLFSPEMLSPPDQHQHQHHQDRPVRTLLIFHCEFSSERAPRMALHIRNLDRSINAASYPRLTYPDVYILEGGYRAYYLAHPQRCEPPGQYLPMRTQRFRDDLRFHQRMKNPTCNNTTTDGSGSGSFTGNKYNRQKVRNCAVGVGLRKSVSTTHATNSTAGCVQAYMAATRLAPGEAMPAEFPSSDGPDICHGSGYIREASNCFL